MSSMMSRLKICRHCFAVGCQLHLIKNKYSEAYEAVTGIKLTDTKCLPPFLCTNCIDDLEKSDRIRRKTLRAHVVYTEMEKKHGGISVEKLQAAMRSSENNSHVEDSEKSDGGSLEDFPIDVKHEQIPVKDTAKHGDDKKKQSLPDDVGTDDGLVGDAAIGPYSVKTDELAAAEECKSNSSEPKKRKMKLRSKGAATATSSNSPR